MSLSLYTFGIGGNLILIAWRFSCTFFFLVTLFSSVLVACGCACANFTKVPYSLRNSLHQLLPNFAFLVWLNLRSFAAAYCCEDGLWLKI